MEEKLITGLSFYDNLPRRNGQGSLPWKNFNISKQFLSNYEISSKHSVEQAIHDYRKGFKEDPKKSLEYRVKIVCKDSSRRLPSLLDEELEAPASRRRDKWKSNLSGLLWLWSHRKMACTRPLKNELFFPKAVSRVPPNNSKRIGKVRCRQIGRAHV